MPDFNKLHYSLGSQGDNLYVLPNPKLAGHRNLTNKKYLINIGYKILGNHIVYPDQCLGAVHPFFYKKEQKLINDSTVILISMMTVACKIIATFTISMGTLVLKCVIFIYGKMSSHMVLVTGGLIVATKIRKIEQKHFELYNGEIFSGYQSLLALNFSGTPSLKIGTRPPSCLHLDNRLYILNITHLSFFTKFQC